MLPKTEKGLRNRIQKYRNNLTREKRIYGGYHDGGGIRYVIFYLLYLLNDDKESKKYIRWYSKNFDDDIGEPYQILFWALILKQIGDVKNARMKLAEHYKSNFYIIPKLIGKKVPDYKFWHSSNYAHRNYADYGPEQALERIEKDELDWMKSEFLSMEFNELREKYIEAYSKLENEETHEKRKAILDGVRNLIPNIFDPGKS